MCHIWHMMKQDQCSYTQISSFSKLKTYLFISHSLFIFVPLLTSLCIDMHGNVISHAFSSQIIQLVEGKASAYVFASPGCKKWDTCATEAILHAVGGNTSFLFVYYFVLFYFHHLFIKRCTNSGGK